MASPLDTPDWELGASIEWKFVGTDTYRDCGSCHGRGELGGGFKGLDGPTTCTTCGGSGGWLNPRQPSPPMPPELVEHMRKAWKEFFGMA